MPVTLFIIVGGHTPETITATPNTAGNYVFGGWTSANGNVTFTDVNSAQTTFEATDTDTIYANFTQDTVYNVTVSNVRPASTSTVQAGTYVTPELTAAAPTDDEYSFSTWVLSGNVSLASGYNLTDQTIKINASGTGGTVTAQYSHTDYIYFYGALQSNWNSNPVVTVDGAEVGAYSWIANKTNSETPVTLYSGTAATSQIGGNNCYTYYIGVYRVPVAKAGTNISVFNSVQTGTDNNKGYCGTVQNDQGRCYYTYSTGKDANHSGSIAPQKVTAVTLDKSDYDGDETVTISKTETRYSGNKTAGQDNYTYTYELVNSSTGVVVKTLGTDLASSTGNYDFVPDNQNISAGTYKIKIHTRDAKTSKIHNTCESSAFVIQTTPTQSTVSASVTNGSVTSRTYTYKNGASTSFNNGASLRAGSVVTLVFTLNTGYTQGTTTKAGVSSVTESYNASTRVLTVTFTVPSGGTAISISHAANEVMHTVTLKKRFYNSDGSSQIGSDVDYTTVSAGITTTASTGNAPDEADYTFHKFTLPSNGVTKAAGNINTSDAITINATVDNAAVYLDYRETIYSITVKNDGHGTVQRNGSDIAAAGADGTTQIGNVTPVSLTAVNNSGYDFKEWVIKKSGTATKVTIGSTEYTLSATDLTVPAATAGATSTFKFNGTATLQANFKAVEYSINAGFPTGNSYTLSSSTGNNVSVSRGSGNIGDSYDIIVLLAPGYEVYRIEGQGITSNMPTPSVSGNTYTYSYTLGAQSVLATVTLKAKTPTLSNVQIKNTTFNYVGYSSGATVPHYYLQPDEVKAATDSFATISYSNTYRSESNKASNVEVSLAADPAIIPAAENGTVAYTLKVKARNDQNGVDTAYSAEQTFTISVSFNSKQKEFFKLSKIYSKLGSESTANNPYYTDAASQITAYNAAYNAATTFYNNGTYLSRSIRRGRHG